jgi:hypothetical protein
VRARFEQKTSAVAALDAAAEASTRHDLTTEELARLTPPWCRGADKSEPR